MGGENDSTERLAFRNLEKEENKFLLDLYQVKTVYR